MYNCLFTILTVLSHLAVSKGYVLKLCRETLPPYLILYKLDNIATVPVAKQLNVEIDFHSHEALGEKGYLY